MTTPIDKYARAARALRRQIQRLDPLNREKILGWAVGQQPSNGQAPNTIICQALASDPERVIFEQKIKQVIDDAEFQYESQVIYNNTIINFPPKAT